jgi:hypothetical protein
MITLGICHCTTKEGKKITSGSWWTGYSIEQNGGSCVVEWRDFKDMKEADKIIKEISNDKDYWGE